MSRRFLGWGLFVTLASGLVLAFGLAGGGRAGLIPGGGSPRSDCFVEFDVQGVTDESNHVVCVDGDPCDADGRCDGVCTFRVRVCVNQSNMSECRPTTFKKPPQASFPLSPPTMGNNDNDSACGAFTDIPVQVRNGKTGRKRLQTRAISNGRPRQDRDILFLLCLPRQGACPTPGSTTTTTTRGATTTSGASTTSTTSGVVTTTSGVATTTTTITTGAVQCCLRSSATGAFTDCMVLSATQCTAQSGISAGAGTCSPNPCPPSSTTTSVVSSTTTTTSPSGAILCCVQSSAGGAFGTCINVSATQCSAQGGINVGPGTCPATTRSGRTRGGVSAVNPCPPSSTTTTSLGATTTTARASTTTTTPGVTTTTAGGATTTTSSGVTTTTALGSTTTTAGATTTTAPSASTTTTTTAGSTTTTIGGCNCCGSLPSLISFTTGSTGCGTNPPGSVSPGRCVQGTNNGTACTSDATCTGGGVCRGHLDCSGLYFGGGTPMGINLPATIPDNGLSFSKVASCSSGNPVLGPSVAADVPGPGCPTPTGTPTYGQRHCTSPGCLFGAPLAIPNPSSTATGTCVVNVVSNQPGAGTGTATCATGDTTLSLPLDSQIYLTGSIEPVRVCSICTGGTIGTCGSGTCQGGPRNGMPCTPETSPLNGSYPTSHDCPPPGAPGGSLVSGCPAASGTFLGCLPIGFNLSTGTQTKTSFTTAAQMRVFCGFCFDPNVSQAFENPPHTCTSDANCTNGNFTSCQQQSNGAFRNPFATTITETGTPPGVCIADGSPHNATLVSLFCIPPSYNGIVDPSGELPGAGAVSLPGQSQFIP